MFLLFQWLILLNEPSFLAKANPISRPYVSSTFVSSENSKDTTIQYLQSDIAKTIIITSTEEESSQNNPYSYNPDEENPRCPLAFNIGTHSNQFYHDNDIFDISRSSGGIDKPPIIAPTNIGEDAGHLEIWYTTNYEHLDKLTTTTTISRSRAYKTNIPYQEISNYANSDVFPLLFESSSFQHTSPIYYDFNSDGKEDIIIVESNRDGRVFVINGDMGNVRSKGKQILLKSNTVSNEEIRIPSLQLQPNWFMATHNDGIGSFKIHSSFTSPLNVDLEKQKGVPADVLHQDIEVTEKRKAAVDERNQAQQSMVERGRKLGIKFDKENVHDDIKKFASLLFLESELINMTSGDDASSAYTEDYSKTDSMTENEKRDRVSSIVAMEAMLENKMLLHNDEEMAKHIASILLVESKLLEEERMNTKEINTESLSKETSLLVDEAEQNASANKVQDKNHGVDMNVKNDESVHIWDDLKEEYIDDDFTKGSYHDDYYYGYQNPVPLMDLVTIDPHVLANPVVAEIKKYKYSEKSVPVLIVPVSYYFDEREYSYMEENHDHPELDSIHKRKKFVGSAILLYDMQLNYWYSEKLLDVSTRDMNSNMGVGAYIHTTPTIVDLDNDKIKDIIVGTSMGFIYALDSITLDPKPGFPMQMPAPIHSQIMAVDLVDSFMLELISIDSEGNIVCLDHTGNSLWTRKLGANVVSAGGLALGDVDGDGILDVVCLTYNESILQKNEVDSYMTLYVLNGQTGQTLPFFPKTFPTNYQVKRTSPQPPLLLDLHSTQSHWIRRLRNATIIDPKSVIRLNSFAAKEMPKSPPPYGGKGAGLHIVTTTSDGYVYITEGGTGCTNRISIGEATHATALADNLHDNGKMGLIFATAKTGEIITMESFVDYHYLNSFHGGGKSGNLESGTRVHGYSSRLGILLPEHSSQFRHIVGFEFPFTFEIFDNRENVPKDVKYSIEVRVGSHINGVILSKEYNSTGIFTESIYIPKKPDYYTLFVKLTDENGVRYEQSFKVGYNINIFQGLEWLVALPLILASLPLLLFSGKKEKLEESNRVGILG